MSEIIYDLILGNRSGPPGMVWTNRPALIDGRFPPGPHPHPLGLWNGQGSGFPMGMETPPDFVLAPSRGRLPLSDAEGLGGTFWLVSDATKRVFETVDPDAFVFCRVAIRNEDGSAYEGQSYWLCDVIRFLDAVDDVKSGTEPRTVGGTKFTRLPLGLDAVFKRAEIGGHHIFRLMYRPSFVGCDARLWDAIEAAGLDGIGVYRAGYVDG